MTTTDQKPPPEPEPKKEESKDGGASDSKSSKPEEVSGSSEEAKPEEEEKKKSETTKQDGDTTMTTTTAEEEKKKNPETSKEDGDTTTTTKPAAKEEEESDKSKQSKNGADDTDASPGGDDGGQSSSHDEGTIRAVVERLEFFFSDANVRQDLFMRRLLTAETGDYPKQVTVEALLRFNTIKRHTKSPGAVAAAAARLSHKLKLSQDGKAIGRVEEFTNEKMGENIPLTLRVSNLPLHDDEPNKEEDGKGRAGRYAVRSDDLRGLFERYGKVMLVQLRFRYVKVDNDDDDDNDKKNNKDNDKNKKGNNKFSSRRRGIPKGSAYVEFESSRDMEKAADDVVTSKDGEKVEPKRKLQIGDRSLEVVTLKEHLDSKQKKRQLERKPAENEDGNKEEKTKEEDAEEEGTKKRKKNDEEEDEEKDAAKEENKDEEDMDEETKETTTPNENKKLFTLDWKKGCVIRLKGLSSSTCDREAILDSVAEAMGTTVDDVRGRKIFADYSRGQVDGAVRFPDPDDVETVRSKLSCGEILIAGSKVGSCYVLEGDEESKYWEDFIDFKNKQRRHKREEKGGHRDGRGRGGKHHKRHKKWK